MIIAGDFISFSPLQIYAVILLMSIPAQIVALPVLFKTFQNQKAWLGITVSVWILVLPVLLMFFTEWLAPNIHSASYRYTIMEQILNFYLPFYGVPPLAAGLLWFFRRKRQAASD